VCETATVQLRRPRSLRRSRGNPNGDAQTRRPDYRFSSKRSFPAMWPGHRAAATVIPRCWWPWRSRAASWSCHRRSPSRGRYRTARDLSQTAAVAGGLGLIRLVGQLDLATHRITDDVPLAPHALQEFVIAGPAHPADRPALGPPLPIFLPGPILLPGTDVAGLIVWWDDFHVQISERPVGRTARWLHPLRLSFAYPTRSVRNRCDQSPRG
jgi:hypothetical protein